METLVTVLIFLFLYGLGVFLYTIIVKNDAMHKFSPFTNVKEIAKEGAVGLAIGISLVVVLLFAVGQVVTFIKV